MILALCNVDIHNVVHSSLYYCERTSYYLRIVIVIDINLYIKQYLTFCDTNRMYG